MLGKLKRVLSQSTHPVNETAEGVPCASGKKGEAGEANVYQKAAFPGIWVSLELVALRSE